MPFRHHAFIGFGHIFIGVSHIWALSQAPAIHAASLLLNCRPPPPSQNIVIPKEYQRFAPRLRLRRASSSAFGRPKIWPPPPTPAARVHAAGLEAARLAYTRLGWRLRGTRTRGWVGGCAARVHAAGLEAARAALPACVTPIELPPPPPSQNIAIPKEYQRFAPRLRLRRASSSAFGRPKIWPPPRPPRHPLRG